MPPQDLASLAQLLDDARQQARSIERLTLALPDLNLADGYTIQEAGLTLRRARGERPIGLKMGLTSEAKRQQMKLDSPVYGVLTDRMRVAAGATFRLEGTIHPKIEPEVAFRIGRTLEGRITRADALAAISGVTSAMEILDSRFRDFKYFSLPDVVADNSSSSHFVVANDWVSPAGRALAELKMVMTVNGEPRQSALSSSISGDPVQSVVQLCALLAERGHSLPEGSIVLAGAATVAEPLKAGDLVSLEVDTLPSVSVRAE